MRKRTRILQDEVGERQQWARSELKTINRLLKENERILRRMGITPRGERLPVTSECYNTLLPQKKNAVGEWVGLRWRRAQLKTQFGA
ncbi:MAG TPA: hypothetical protein VEF35_06790 [Candidatus Bathyarchaeia archaeon]|nr:hypothetical protein [Candidatus Bathyarchaeia archaeon]